MKHGDTLQNCRTLYLSVRDFSKIHDTFDPSCRTSRGLMWEFTRRTSYISMYYAYPDTFGVAFDAMVMNLRFIDIAQKCNKVWILFRIMHSVDPNRMESLLVNLLRDITHDEYYYVREDVKRCVISDDNSVLYPRAYELVMHLIEEPCAYHSDITPSQYQRIVAECIITSNERRI